jgi:glycosyltransferase involved in cell wall biosynthesis
MRLWDYASAGRVDYFVANSRFIASRIRKYYGRESRVIHPPVETAVGNTDSVPGDYYLTVGRLVDYKRFDMAVTACNQLGRRLKIIGVGPQYNALKKMAGKTVEFLGRVGDSEMHAQVARCRALLFPGEEDFGMVPVEAHSFGRPVIAYAAGGALETVRGDLPDEPAVDNPTGVFFTDQSASSLVGAILDFESKEDQFSPQAIRKHSLQFDKAVFKSQFADFVRFAIKDFMNRNHA